MIANPARQRPCEKQVGQRHWQFKVSASSTKLASPRQAGVRLGQALELAEWRYDDDIAGPRSDGRTVSECYPYTTIVGAAKLGYDVERRLPPGRILPIELWRPRAGALRSAKFNFAPIGAMPAPASPKPGPRMNAREKTNRDNEIVAARIRGQSWTTIAANYGLSERQCQNVLADYRASHPRLREPDPIEILDDMLDHYQGAQEEFAEISATSKHDATRVGAIRTRREALAAQASLLRAVGVLPRDLGVLRADIDAQAMAGQANDVLNRFGVSMEARRALLAALSPRKNGLG